MSNPLPITLVSQFQERFKTVDDEYTAESAELGEGTPIFTKEDIYATDNDLDIFLRAIFVEKGITKEYFHVVFHRYARTVLGLTGTQAGNMKGNLLKALLKGGITMSRFVFAVGILGNMHNFTIDLEHRGTISHFDLNELKHRYKHHKRVGSLHTGPDTDT